MTRPTPRTGGRPGGPASASAVPHPGWALALLCCAQFMVVLDTTIVTVALPSIRAELGIDSQADLTYVISLYALCFGGLLILAGRLADDLGRRRMFGAGLAAFTIASLGCGLAPNAGVLLLGRALQGAGSAAVSAAALALLTTVFPEGPGRHRALGAWGAVGGAAGAVGLLLGGTLTDLIGWEAIFLINVPIGAIAVVAAPRLLPAARPPDGTPTRLDPLGTITVTGGIGSLIFGLGRIEQSGFSAATIGLLMASPVLLACFVVIERRVDAPLVRFRLFRSREVAWANVAMFILMLVISSQLFFTTLYVQRVLEFSALRTGLAFVPNSVLVLVGSTLASRLALRWGIRPVLTAGLGCVGFACLLLSRVSVDGSYFTHVLPGFALTGFGLGLSVVCLTLAATRGVDEGDRGLASGVINTAQQLGFAVGTAAIVGLASMVAAHGPGSASHRLVSGYAVGYLIDASLAVLAAVASASLLRSNRAGEDGGRSALSPRK